MKRILATAVLAMAAGSAYAADFSDLQNFKASEVKTIAADYAIPAVKAEKAVSNSSLTELYTLWLENNFVDPTDKQLVAGQMHKSLKITTSADTLIVIRMMLSREIYQSQSWAEHYEDSIQRLAKELKEDTHNTAYSNMTVDEIIAKILAQPDPGETVWIWREHTIIEYAADKKAAEERKAEVQKERDLVDARLAELN